MHWVRQWSEPFHFLSKRKVKWKTDSRSRTSTYTYSLGLLARAEANVNDLLVQVSSDASSRNCDAAVFRMSLFVVSFGKNPSRSFISVAACVKRWNWLVSQNGLTNISTTFLSRSRHWTYTWKKQDESKFGRNIGNHSSANDLLDKLSTNSSSKTTSDAPIIWLVHSPCVMVTSFDPIDIIPRSVPGVFPQMSHSIRVASSRI